MSTKYDKLSFKFSRFRRYVMFTKLLSSINFKDLSACWEWKGGVNKGGYGSFWWPEKRIYTAHVASYELFRGKRNGKDVCHSCDNTLCINPSHLWLGTQQQNMNDMIRKGRANDGKGEHNGHAKLTLNSIQKIKVLYSKGGYTQKDLGYKFGISQAHVSTIINEKTWIN